MYITQAALRDRFNALNLGEKLRKGEVSLRILKEWDAPPSLGFPDGSKSQLVSYVGADGKQFATAHRYRAPDGTLLASGRADPKTLREGDTLYQIQRV